MGKTKIMVSGMDLDLLMRSGKDPCGVCQKGVGSNAIFCGGCMCWIHKKCSGIKGPLCPNPDFCNVKAKDEVSSDSFLSMLGIQDLDVVLRTSRMRWFGHVERSTGWIAKVRKLNVVAQKRPGRPKKNWDEVLVDDRKKLGMDSADPQKRSEWRGRLRRRLVKQAQPSVEENSL